MATGPGNEDLAVGAVWAALAVRADEVARVRRAFIASALVGLALVSFFSGSNALFLDQVGADALPWVYLTNAPLVIAAGLGYSAWSRRTSTETVLNASIWILAATVAGLWVWVLLGGGQASAFALAVWFRFLFIFGFLGLWEVSSALFDIRQAKRLFPAIALGAMLAFMIGGAVVSFAAALVGTEQLILLSAVFFVLYGIAFRASAADADLGHADDAPPARPRDIVADRFSRDLAFMRSITILLVFVTEFIFYEQVEATFASDETIARFLGLFMAGGTLAMVIVTAVISSWFIARFGIGVGLAAMPAGLLISALVLGVYGTFVGIDGTFFVLAVVANVVNMVLANAIETPVGAVLYQPMPAERRMPVRVAVDGWLGSVALALAGVLLLVFQALDTATVLPFVWLLAAIGFAGVLLSRRLYGDYLAALQTATTLAFGSGGSANAFAAIDEGEQLLHTGLVGEDPAAAFAIAALVSDLDDHPLRFVVPELIGNDDDAVAAIGIDAMARSGDDVHVPRLMAVVEDSDRSPEVRASALAAVAQLDPANAAQRARTASAAAPDDALANQALAIRLANHDEDAIELVVARTASTDNRDRLTAARIMAASPSGTELPPQATAALLELLRDTDVAPTAIEAANGRVTAALANRLIDVGRNLAYRNRAVAALATAGPVAIEATEPQIDSLPDRYLRDLVEHVYGSSTRRPKLLHRFVHPDTESATRRAGFGAIARADIDLPATVARMLRDDVQRATTLIGATRTTDYADQGLIAFACADEFAAVQRTLWAGLRLAGDAQRLDELEAVVAGRDPEQRANAIEALDTLLPRATRDLVVPVLEPASLAEAADLAPASLDPVPLTELRREPWLCESTRRLLDHYLAKEQLSQEQLSSETEPDMSQVIERVVALKRVDIFATLSYELLVELAEVVDERTASAGTAILTEGEIGDELFALIDGRVQVDRSADADVAVTLEAGTVFGELAVLAPGPRSATVIAVTECTTLVLSRSTLLALVDRHPSVMSEIARVLAERLQAAAGSGTAGRVSAPAESTTAIV